MKFSLKIVLLVIFSLYTFLTFIFAFNGYPGFIQDSTCFLPTAYFINHFHQLINPLYDAGLDPIQHRFLFYPPLFPYVVALINNLMPEFYNNMQVTLTIIDLLGLIVLLISIYTYIKKYRIRSSNLLYVLSIIWLIALFSFYGVQEGRPEVLCKFFIACFLLNNIHQSKRFLHFNNGLLVGLNLITSPVSTFYLMVITFGLLFYRKQFKIKPILTTLLGFAIVLSIFSILYPYHLSELIVSLQKHSRNVIVNRIGSGSLKNFVSFYISYAYTPLLFFNFLISILFCIYVLLMQRKYVSLLLLVVLVGLIGYFSFKDMPMNYNMIVMAPIFFFLIFVMITKLLAKRMSTWFTKTSLAFVMMVLMVNSLGFLRKSMLFLSTKNEQVSYLTFRKKFLKTIDNTSNDKKVAITFSLWPYCLDQYQHITMNSTDPSVQYLMFQQLYSGDSQPPVLPNYKVINNNFITEHPKLWYLPLGNTYPWFQTAVYERK